MTAGDKLQDDLNSAEFRHGVDQLFWELVQRDGMTVYIRLFAADQRSFLGRFSCEKYGEQPIDCKFVDPETHACVESAWPRGNPIFEQWVKFRTPHLFVCWDQDADGIKHHEDWRPRKAWTKTTNQVVAYLNFLRGLLNLPKNGYERRTI